MLLSDFDGVWFGDVVVEILIYMFSSNKYLQILDEEFSDVGNFWLVEVVDVGLGFVIYGWEKRVFLDSCVIIFFDMDILKASPSSYRSIAEAFLFLSFDVVQTGMLERILVWKVYSLLLSF